MLRTLKPNRPSARTVLVVAAAAAALFIVGLAVGRYSWSSSQGNDASASSILTPDPIKDAREQHALGASIVDPAVFDSAQVTVADSATQSQLVSSSTYSIEPAHTKTITASCGSGWYVRPGQNTTSGPSTLVNIGLIVNKSSTWIDNEGTTPSGYVDKPGSVFSTFSVEFYNASLIHSHSVSFSWWCDKVPSWYSGYSDSPTNSAPGTTAPADATPVGDTVTCVYCSETEKLTNLGTGLALDTTNTATGAPLLVQSPGSPNQQWYLQGASGGSAFVNGIATFGLWRYQKLINYAIAEDPTSKKVSFVSAANGNAPNYGRFYYIDHGAGSPFNAVMLVSTQTGDCLSAPAGAGSQAVGAPCDATDKTQWWVTS